MSTRPSSSVSRTTVPSPSRFDARPTRRSISQRPSDVETFRNSFARSPSAVTTRSRRPSLSKSATAAPRCAPGLIRSRPVFTDTSSNVPLPRLSSRALPCRYRPSLDPFDVVGDVAIRREQILPAVVVVVRDRIAPTRVRQCGLCNPRQIGYILEVCFRVAEQQEALVRKVGHEQIEAPVVVDVAQIRAHRRHGRAELIDSHTPRCSHVFERAVTAIAKQNIRFGVVCDEHVGPSIFIYVTNRRSHAFSEMARDARVDRHITECSVAIVPEQLIRQRRVVSRMAVGTQSRPVLAAVRLAGRVPDAVIDDEQVEPAIDIEVQPCAVDAPHRAVPSDADWTHERPQ